MSSNDSKSTKEDLACSESKKSKDNSFIKETIKLEKEGCCGHKTTLEMGIEIKPTVQWHTQSYKDKYLKYKRKYDNQTQSKIPVMKGTVVQERRTMNIQQDGQQMSSAEAENRGEDYPLEGAMAVVADDRGTSPRPAAVEHEDGASSLDDGFRSLDSRQMYGDIEAEVNRILDHREALNHVTFAEKENQLYTSIDNTEEEPPPSPGKGAEQGGGAKAPTPPPASPTAKTFKGTLLQISPVEQFVFCVEDEGTETLDILNLTNISPEPVAYKVKTTTPDNYRVRTSTGIIRPDKSTDIYVYLQPGVSGEAVKKDKFLVMAMQVDDPNMRSSALSQKWKAVNKAAPTYMEHRLWCSIKAPDGEEKTEVQRIHDKLDQLHTQLLSASPTPAPATSKPAPDTPVPCKPAPEERQQLGSLLDRQRQVESSLQWSNRLLLVFAFFLLLCTFLLGLEVVSDYLTDPAAACQATGVCTNVYKH